MSKAKIRKYGCTHCGRPFEAYPPDDRHTIATRTEGEYEDQIKLDYKCECNGVNTIYWSKPDVGVAVVRRSQRR